MLRRSRLIPAIGIAFAWAATAVAGESSRPVEDGSLQEIAGLYECVGENYTGKVAIRKVGETYRLRWTIGGKTHLGVAIREGNFLASSWSTGRGVGGVVVYEILPGRRLVGRYGAYRGDGSLRTESLTFIEPPAELPPPRSWEVGESALVNWSRDQYWYPATVAKKKGKRYHVRFDDGDEEWTDASRMTEEDIKIDDRVFCNREEKGRYYPGRVTERDGLTIHVRYDRGGEETTTISLVRVLRPREE